MDPSSTSFLEPNLKDSRPLRYSTRSCVVTLGCSPRCRVERQKQRNPLQVYIHLTGGGDHTSTSSKRRPNIKKSTHLTRTSCLDAAVCQATPAHFTPASKIRARTPRHPDMWENIFCRRHTKMHDHVILVTALNDTCDSARALRKLRCCGTRSAPVSSLRCCSACFDVREMSGSSPSAAAGRPPALPTRPPDRRSAEDDGRGNARF